jgi:surface polysaccharide O-acyltransferase-like enzyme
MSLVDLQEKKHVPWADRLRNWATLLVVVVHVAGPVAEAPSGYGGSVWWAGNLWDALARPAVPLFVMLSGYLLLGKPYGLSDFLKRRFVRVLVPACCWMLVYSFYNYLAKGQPATLMEGLRGMVAGPVHYHLWFVYLILGLYLMWPILSPWARQADDAAFLFVLLVWILGTWVYKYLLVFHGLQIGLLFNFYTDQGGFFVMGYYLGHKMPAGELQAVDGIRNWKLDRKGVYRLSLALVLLGTTITAGGTWWASVQYGQTFHPYFYDYLTPGVTLSAFGWFLLARHSWGKRPLLSVEKALAAGSFGMYFIHILAMDWWSEAGYWQSKGHPALWIPAVVVLVWSISFLTTGLIRAIPGGKRIT